MVKEIHSGIDARLGLLEGIHQIVDLVSVTLGPSGKNVLLEDAFGRLQSTRDGVSIVREMLLKDRLPNAGARLLKQAAEHTNYFAGDGTTTATVLTGKIVSEGMKNVAAGANPVEVKKGIDKAVTLATEELLNISKGVESTQDIINVATISAANDKSIGELIGSAVDIIGKEGIITLQDYTGNDLVLEISEGMSYPTGYKSPEFITDPDTMKCILEDTIILMYDGNIDSIDQLLPLMESVIDQKKSLLVICKEIADAALATLVLNTPKNNMLLKCCVTALPSFGAHTRGSLEDIAILTGGKVIDGSGVQDLRTVDKSVFGQAKQVVVDRKSTTIVSHGHTSKEVKNRIKCLEFERDQEPAQHIKEKIQQRIGRLSKGAAIIKVGASSEYEQRDIKYRVEDAVLAVRSAVEEGIVPGGGTVQLLMSKHIEDNIQNFAGEQRLGAEIVMNALRYPIKKIAENTGISGDVVLEHVLAEEGNTGFNAAVGEYVDMFEAGVTDATKVTRLSLQNAASVAGQIILTDAVVLECPEEEKAHKHIENEFS